MDSLSDAFQTRSRGNWTGNRTCFCTPNAIGQLACTAFATTGSFTSNWGVFCCHSFIRTATCLSLPAPAGSDHVATLALPRAARRPAIRIPTPTGWYTDKPNSTDGYGSDSGPNGWGDTRIRSPASQTPKSCQTSSRTVLSRGRLGKSTPCESLSLPFFHHR